MGDSIQKSSGPGVGAHGGGKSAPRTGGLEGGAPLTQFFCPFFPTFFLTIFILEPSETYANKFSSKLEQTIFRSDFEFFR